MARNASMSPAECETMLGQRGALTVNVDNRHLVRKWLVARGVPSSHVGTLAMAALQGAYNDVTDLALNALCSAQHGVESMPQSAPMNSPPVAEQSAPRANGHANGHDKDSAAQLAALIAKLAGGAVDHEQVARIVDEKISAAMARVPTVRIELTRRDGSVAELDGHHHPQFAKLLKLATAPGHDGYTPGIFISGEASSGKTTGCKMLAKALDLPWHFNGAITMPHEMLGFIDGAGNYHRTPFREAYENGGVYTFDEVDRSDANALLAVNPHLANGVATFPDKQVQRHKDCIIVCTANTWGLGADANYAGATKLDAAFLSRFPRRLNWDIDTALEIALSGNEQWANRVIAARRRAREAGIKVMIDMRMTLAGAGMIADGMSPDDAAAHTYLANLKPEQRNIVEGTV